MEYLLHLLIMCCIYTMITSSTGLLAGMANILSLCQAAFYGIGAYVSTLCLMYFHLSLLPSLFIILVINAIIALILALPSLRLRGDYFVIATMGFQLIIYAILYNWTNVTRGPFGISNIPAPRLAAQFSISEIKGFTVLSVIFTMSVLFLIYNLINSPFGRILKAIREDEAALLIIGKNPNTFKIYAFMISSALIGFSGFLFAVYVGYIDPTSFTLDESIFILSAVLIGGTGNIKGPLCGAVFVIILPEILRYTGFSDMASGPVRQIFYGITLIVVLYFRPRGIAGVLKLK